jgi:RHS repeat-associated protein
VTGNARWGAGNMTIVGSGGSTYNWYSPSGTLLLANTGTYATAHITGDISELLKVKTVNGIGCVSTIATSVGVHIEPLPTIHSDVNRLAKNSPVTLTTTSSYLTYQWKDPSNSVVSTTSSATASSTGNYGVTVTKNGMPGTGTAVFRILGQMEDVDMNYIITNTALVPVTDASALEGLSVDQASQSIQYFDGLGRLVQTVTTQGSPTKHDVIQPISYDAFGREAYKYLPYVGGTTGVYKDEFIARDLVGYATGSNPQYNFYQGTSNIASDTAPYSETTFEMSPLNRPVSDRGPGVSWLAANKVVTHAYPLNRHGTGSNEEKIIIWYIDANGLPKRKTSINSGYYPSQVLLIKSTKDEHGNEVREYLNKSGKAILKKVYAAGTITDFNTLGNWAETYYVYDDFGLLRYVFQPELSRILAGGTSAPLRSELNRYAFQYKYDSRNRMIQKRMPASNGSSNADSVYIVYDKRDRVVLTQDGNQRSSYKWSFTKYDSLNRPVMTGVYTHTSLINQQAMTALFAGRLCEVVNTGATHGYTTSAFPTTNLDILSVTYYDDYSYIKTNWGTGFNYVDDALTSGTSTLPHVESAGTRGKTVGTKIKVLDATGLWLRAISYYDDKGRPIQSISEHHANGKERATTLLDFASRPLKTKRVTTKGSATNTVEETFSYDHSGRLTLAYHSLNGATPVLMTSNEYNELGQLVDKKLHSTNSGGNFAQSIDYRYNIRGWLLSVNHSDLTSGNNLSEDQPSEGNDLFGMELGYEKSIGSGNALMYNGNISAIRWSKDMSMDSTVKEVAYNYSYDPMNRIISATHRFNTLGAWGNAGKLFNESGYTYDLNGNIKSLVRRNDIGAVMDSLAYDYGSTASNLLLKVTDAGDKTAGFIEPSSTTGDDYSYDKNGNMITDKNKGITQITYDHLNLPVTVTKSTGDYLTYTYNSSGMKLRQDVFNPSNVLKKRTDYVGAYVYENDTLRFINTAEGRVVMTGAQPEYQYHLKDHLGNVRVTFTTRREVETSTATLESATAVSESNTFNPSYGNATIINATVYNHTPGGSRSQRLTAASSNDIIGLTKSLRVMPGDTINAEVYARYLAPTTTNTNVPAQILAAMLSAFGVSAASTGEGHLLYEAVNEMSIANLLVTSGSGVDPNLPKVYLNYILFDSDFLPYDMGFDQVSNAGASAHEKLSVSALATKPGYAYIYFSNENGKVVEVYFDDFKVEHVKSPIIQSQDYYPFGLTFNSYSKENSVNNPYQYNGKEKQDEVDLGWLDYGARVFMPEIGRWDVTDPYAEKYYSWTPFNYTFNNPVLFVDKDGRDGMVTTNDASGTKKDPIVLTIKANYYYNSGSLSKAQVTALNKSISNFNASSSTFKGEDGKTYQVRYDLSLKGLDTDAAVNDAVKGDTFSNANGGTSTFGNKIVNAEAAQGDDALGADVGGSSPTGGSNTIRIYDSNVQKGVTAGFDEGTILESMFNHEIGHNLGGEHGDPNPMNDGHITFGYRQNPNCLGNCTGEPYVQRTFVHDKFSKTIIKRIKEPVDVYYLQNKKK